MRQTPICKSQDVKPYIAPNHSRGENFPGEQRPMLQLDIKKLVARQRRLLERRRRKLEKQQATE